MKAKFILATVLLMGVFILPAQAGITGVIIQPPAPTVADNISFDIFGVEGSGGVTVTDATYTLDENLITLDLSLDVGPLLEITPWDYTYDIGLLSIGTYDLTVNSIVAVDPTTNSTFTTSFEVVPEPTTFLLVGTGILYLRRKKRTTSKK